MSAVVLTIANIKGGIGKTTTAVCLADALMQKGRAVLLVDCDPQRNASSVYRAQINGAATLYDVFFSGYAAEQCIQRTGFGDIIPNDPSLKNVDAQITPNVNMYKHLKKLIAPVKDKYDYIIFDTPPGQGSLLLGNSLYCSDYVILPIETELFSIQAINDIYSLIKEFQEDNEKLRILGLLKVKWKRTQNLTKDLEDNILPKYARDMNCVIFNTPIRESVKVKEANTGRLRLSTYAPNCTAAKDYRELADEIETLLKGVK